MKARPNIYAALTRNLTSRDERQGNKLQIVFLRD